jgi:hypothetical protein
MKYCPKCGFECQDQDVYCVHCGHHFTDVASADFKETEPIKPEVINNSPSDYDAPGEEAPKTDKSVPPTNESPVPVTIVAAPESPAPRILAIVCLVTGILGIFAALPCGIVSLCLDKKHKYLVMDIIGMALYAFWFILALVLVATGQIDISTFGY